jgi:hypothetical protein
MQEEEEVVGPRALVRWWHRVMGCDPSLVKYLTEKPMQEWGHGRAQRRLPRAQTSHRGD